MESTELVVNQEDKLVEQLAAPLIESFKKQRAANKRFRSQQRDSWNRMNRPHKLQAMEAGGGKLYALVARFKV